MSKHIKIIKLEPKTIVDKMTEKSTIFSVHNLTVKDRLRILFSKTVWFRMLKATLWRMDRG